MDEITRFMQLRPAQTLPSEVQQFVGIPLYPGAKLSKLALALKGVSCDKTKYSSTIAKYIDSTAGQHLVKKMEQVHPVLQAVYDWVGFKSRPISEAGVLEFFGKELPGTVKASEKLDLVKAWHTYADSFVVSIYKRERSCIEFQRLIQALSIYQRAGDTNIDAQPAAILADKVNAILDAPVVIPEGLLNSRCCDGCTPPASGELPLARMPGHNTAAVIREMKCECKCDERCHEPSDHCMCIRTYVADLFLVKEQLVRYEEGEIAGIENVLAGESKVRRHRTLFRTEDTTENERETITSEERDHQVSEKLSLQSEVKSTVNSKIGVDAGVTATFKYGNMVTLTPHANVTAAFSKSESRNTARSYAKDLVNRSVAKMQEKVRKVETSKVISEIEERNKHGIDNTGPSADHRAGLYYWVNKITHAQVFDYGKRMMFDAIIPEPAAMFKDLFRRKTAQDNKIAEPEKPNVTPRGITRDNYGNLLSQFAVANVEDCEPPADAVSIQFAFSKDVTEPDAGRTTGFSSNEFRSPDIPKGYKAIRLDYDVRCSTGHPMSTSKKDEVAVTVNVGAISLMSKNLSEFDAAEGGLHLPLPNANWVSTNHHAMNGEEGNLTVAVAGFTSMGLSLSGTLSVTCKLKDDALEKWQIKIYNVIMTDYNRKLDAYKAGLRDDSPLIQIKGRNPFLNREIERNELKRHIVAILMCNCFNGIGSMREHMWPCGYPEFDFATLEQDAPFIQFFEQVFEWTHATYVFYHSMWARKCKWPELINEDSGDALFDKFLTAGAARVQVPIRPGMEELFGWFLKTGQIWGSSGQPPMSGDSTYVSMIQEVKEGKQGDYSDRDGVVAATQGSHEIELTGSAYYWSTLNNQPDPLRIGNDIDRELLLDFKVHRIVGVTQTNPGDTTSWTLRLDRPFEGATSATLKHAVGAVFVGAPWEIVLPTKLVYLRNTKDKLPTYPLA